MSRKHAKRNAPRHRGGLPVDNAPVQDDRLRTVNCDVAGIDIGRMMKHVAKKTDGIYATEGWDGYLQHWFDAMNEADDLAIEPAKSRKKPSN